MTTADPALKFDHVCMKPEEVDYVIYHGKCSDGFTSALAAIDILK